MLGARVAALLLALGLRLWGLKQGLPYAYNADENAHFLPRAIGMFGHELDPGYFVNPPAYTYVLHVLLASATAGAWRWRGVRDRPDDGVDARARRARSSARWPSACSTSPAAARRRAACSPAALLAVAFLPVFYATCAQRRAHARAAVPRAVGRGRRPAHGPQARLRVAGIGTRPRRATKYTGGIVLLALLAAASRRTAARRCAGCARRRRGARRVPRREPVRADRLPRVPRRAHHQSDASGEAAASSA